MEKIEEQFELSLFSDDWGEANLNPMVRAFGLKDEEIDEEVQEKVRCSSCLFFRENEGCVFTLPFSTPSEYIACKRHKVC